MNHTLIYFTESYPYGIGETWKTNELKILSQHFEKIYIVPLWFAGTSVPKILEEKNIEVVEPCFETLYFKMHFNDIKLLFNWQAFKEFLKRGILLKKSRLIKWFRFVKFASLLENSLSYKFIVEKTNSQTTWYFFWARGWADLVPFLRISKKPKLVARFHGYDLYEERNGGYIPFRQLLIKRLDVILPISLHGKKYLSEKFPKQKKKMKLMRLGTRAFGLSHASCGSCLKIVSCSAVIPVKRLDRIISALSIIEDINIIWTHIGDGQLLQSLMEECRVLPSNITVRFVGRIDTDKVASFYIKNECDVFINTSESEGVPVAIMEALAAGIPVIASNVGGTSEIVDDKVGKLLPSPFLPLDLADAIRSFYHLSGTEKDGLRERAYDRFLSHCNAEFWANELIHVLR